MEKKQQTHCVCCRRVVVVVGNDDDVTNIGLSGTVCCASQKEMESEFVITLIFDIPARYEPLILRPDTVLSNPMRCADVNGRPYCAGLQLQTL